VREAVSPVQAPESIYLDWNATAPPHPEVVAAVQSAAVWAWANPSSVHGPGRRARAALDREAVARLCGLSARDVVLTSGGTEANNLALWGLLGQGGGALVVGGIEHPSVLRAAEALATRGILVRVARPLASGVVPLDALGEALEQLSGAAAPLVASLQAVNHETGVIQPVAGLVELGHRLGAVVHVDVVQAVGKLDPCHWEGADLLSIAAHKIRGPKGIGALVTRPALRLRPLLHGGAQEQGLRPGTQDAAAAAGFAVAAERAVHGATEEAQAAIASLRDELEQRLFDLGAALGCQPLRNGASPRTAQVSNLSWPGWTGPELCAALDLEGVAVSSGAACSAGTPEPSRVVAAMLGAERAASAVRISLGEETTRAEVDRALAAFGRVLSRCRRAYR
jgi:cysteine desulfurase